MSNDVAVIDASVKPLTKKDIVAQKRLVREVMEAVMKEGTHYGVIPGCKQPTLYKAGSETILSTFRVAVCPIVDDLSGPDIFRYRVIARGVIPSGEIVGEGIGECSTDEEKYKWRAAVCPEEFDATPEDRRRIIWKKADNYPRNNYQIKQVRTNPADLANTVLKMAKKRAQIDLTLTATGASDVFTQDLEDLPEEIREGMAETDKPRSGKPEVKKPEEKKTAAKAGAGKETGTPADPECIEEGAVRLLYARLKGTDITPEDVKAHYGIEHLNQIKKADINNVLAAIKNKEIKHVEATVEPGADQSECPHCQGALDENGYCHNPDAPNCPNAEPPA